MVWWFFIERSCCIVVYFSGVCLPRSKQRIEWTQRRSWLWQDTVRKYRHPELKINNLWWNDRQNRTYQNSRGWMFSEVSFPTFLISGDSIHFTFYSLSSCSLLKDICNIQPLSISFSCKHKDWPCNTCNEEFLSHVNQSDSTTKKTNFTIGYPYEIRIPLLLYRASLKGSWLKKDLPVIHSQIKQVCLKEWSTQNSGSSPVV